MQCPGCGAYLSNVLDDYRNGETFRCCGLSWTAADEVLKIRQKSANAEVTAAAEAAIKRADRAEAEARHLRTQIDDIRAVLDRKPGNDW